MRARLLFAAAAALALLACSDSSTEPRRATPVARAQDEDGELPENPGEDPSEDGTCRSGFHVATRSDGTLRCYVDVE